MVDNEAETLHKQRPLELQAKLDSIRIECAELEVQISRFHKRAGRPEPISRGDDTQRSKKCSFCAKPGAQIRELLFGPKSQICDECIGLCNEILEEDSIIPSLLDSQLDVAEAALLLSIYSNSENYLVKRAADGVNGIRVFVSDTVCGAGIEGQVLYASAFDSLWRRKLVVHCGKEDSQDLYQLTSDALSNAVRESQQRISVGETPDRTSAGPTSGDEAFGNSPDALELRASLTYLSSQLLQAESKRNALRTSLEEYKKGRKKSKNRLSCTFCDTGQDQTKKLIAGPGVYICDYCVVLSNRILDEALYDRDEPSTSDLQQMMARELLERTFSNSKHYLVRLVRGNLEGLQVFLGDTLSGADVRERIQYASALEYLIRERHVTICAESDSERVYQLTWKGLCEIKRLQTRHSATTAMKPDSH